MSCGLLHKVPTVYYPFLDHVLYDFLTSIPPSMLADGTFHTDTLLRAFPEVAHIPFAESGAKTGDFAHYASFASRVALYAAWTAPASVRRNSSAVWSWLRSALSRDYRRRCGTFASPARLLYALQLEALRNRIT